VGSSRPPPPPPRPVEQAARPESAAATATTTEGRLASHKSRGEVGETGGCLEGFSSSVPACPTLCPSLFRELCHHFCPALAFSSLPPPLLS
jgi:hypothetical protein